MFYELIWASPFGSGYSLYLLFHFITQKDVASIPHAKKTPKFESQPSNTNQLK